MLIGHSFNPSKIQFSNSAKSLIDDIISSDFEDIFKNKALLYCTISEFIKSSTISDTPQTEFDLYRKAMAYISEHYREDITLSFVAQSVCVSSAHLSRVINNGSKMSFSDIVNSLRIHYAKKIIEQTDTPISDTAYESGYGSIRNFNRIFKKYFGANPKEHRERIRNNGIKKEAETI